MKIQVHFVCIVMTVQVWQIIRNFSFRQRLHVHLLLELLYGELYLLDERLRHEMKKLMLLSLRVQMYLLSVRWSFCVLRAKMLLYGFCILS